MTCTHLTRLTKLRECCRPLSWGFEVGGTLFAKVRSSSQGVVMGHADDGGIDGTRNG